MIDLEKGLVGSGVYSSATRLAKNLQDIGFEVDINGSNSNYDIYHFHTALPMSFIRARILSKIQKRKYKLVMHGHTTIEDFRNSFLFSNRIDRILVPYLKRYYSYADNLIAVSDYNKQILHNYGYNIDKISVISNGIDLSKKRGNLNFRSKARERLGITDDQFLIMSLGIAIYRKAPDVFSDIAKLTPEHRFIWPGKYLSLGTVAHSKLLREKYLQSRKLKNINFTDYVSYFTLMGLWNAADIFLYCSREENQGIALLESMAYGIVPVVRDHPVFNWLTDGKDCLKAKTVEEFSLKIHELHENKSLLNKLRKNGVNTLNQHDMKKTIKAIADLYTEIT